MDHFSIVLPGHLAYVSRDIDFLARSAGDRTAVERMAAVLHGQAAYPNRRALTALIGQAVKPVDKAGFYNVDIVAKVLAEKRAPDRLALTEAQLRIAIEVARKFQLDVAREHGLDAKGRPPTLPFAKLIERLALGDAGRKVAKRHGICVADALEPAAVAHEAFTRSKLPQLLPLMSSQRRAELGFD